MADAHRVTSRHRARPFRGCDRLARAAERFEKRERCDPVSAATSATTRHRPAKDYNGIGLELRRHVGFIPTVNILGHPRGTRAARAIPSGDQGRS